MGQERHQLTAEPYKIALREMLGYADHMMNVDSLVNGTACPYEDPDRNNIHHTLFECVHLK